MAQRKIDRRQLMNILALHEKFLHDEYGGKRADLSGAILPRANLADATLSDADLSYANLTGTYLPCANLSGANLSRAILTGTYLTGANLTDADLSRADLSRADLRYASLAGANLAGADLTGADLSGARGLDTAVANKYTAGFHMVPPTTGTYTAWKKASSGYLVKLLIPEDALRSSATTRKCRASKAVVLGIYTLEGKDTPCRAVCSSYDHDFFYRVGETAEVFNFDTDRWNECAPGIHHFLTMDEAVRY